MLTHEQRKERRETIRSLLQGGASPEALAEEYGLSRDYVRSHIGRGLDISRPPREPANAGRDAEVFHRYQVGESSGDIARGLGVSRQRVFQIVHRQSAKTGVRLRKGWVRRGRYVAPTEVVTRYVSDPYLSVPALAREVGVDAWVMKRALKEAGVKLEWRQGAVKTKEFIDAVRPVYDEYLAGATAEELFARYGMSPTLNAFRGKLTRYQRAAGAPLKEVEHQHRRGVPRRDWRKENANGKTA